MIQKVKILAWLLLLSGLVGCQQNAAPEQVAAIDDSLQVKRDQVWIEKGSAKQQHLALVRIQAEDAPVIPPLNASLAYNEQNTVRIFSPISGRVVSQPITLGASVTAGSVLLKLDSPDFNAALSDVEKSSADLKLKQESFERAKSLFNSKVTSQKEYAEAQDQLASAKSEFERARKRLENLGGVVNQQQVSFHLRAPIAGTVTEASINIGMEVRPDLETPLYVISDLSKIWLWMDVFEKDIAQVSLDQPVKVKISSYRDLVFTGKVDYISRTVNEKTRAIRVRSILDNPEQRLLPTMSAQATILNLPAHKPLLVPLAAVLNEGGKSFVFVKTQETEQQTGYAWREITLGLRLQASAIVLEGLSAGDEVIAQGAMALRQQMLLALEQSS